MKIIVVIAILATVNAAVIPDIRHSAGEAKKILNRSLYDIDTQSIDTSKQSVRQKRQFGGFGFGGSGAHASANSFGGGFGGGGGFGAPIVSGPPVFVSPGIGGFGAGFSGSASHSSSASFGLGTGFWG